MEAQENYIVLNRDELDKMIMKRLKDPSERGLLIIGNMGVGKSKVLRETFSKYDKCRVSGELEGRPLDPILNIAKAFKSSNDISRIFSTGGESALFNSLEYFRNRTKLLPLAIDDVGVEIVGNYYGQTLDVFPKLIENLYDAKVCGKPIKLFLTSNYDLDMLRERYGDRIPPRIKVLCDLVILEDTNLRDEEILSYQLKLKS